MAKPSRRMIVTTATEAAPGQAENEDQVFQHGDLVGVIDGVTAPIGMDTGCTHGPAWYARRLATRLVEASDSMPGSELAGVLAQAIGNIRGDHQGRCDLDNPATPAATVCLLQAHPDHVEYLLLADSPLVVQTDEAVTMLTDVRFEEAMTQIRRDTLIGDVAIGSPEHIDRQRQVALRKRTLTNTAEGYWIAAADPDAAWNAITGTIPRTGPRAIRRAALLTDGASCAVDIFGLFDWAGLLDHLDANGPHGLIEAVRQAEREDSDGFHRPRYKRHDDATVAYCQFTEE